ncbi:universal stress protein [Paenibacillus eucommiae]|uniref:Nucleotide-binding universal stress UspA family protein n=1 Tax=Paenibacillus eucommiae TaxID=1355755 RepID=A0ABS4IYQ5_9BACL|nr:universal stress protein [Paenibacillus eucommiae]MBP1992717.1 nucleotide-binding universal stress UspA family protein [Paenibacillus eucommiae]
MVFANVLVAYDGSDLSKKALTYALNLVTDNPSARLHVVHVYQFPAFVIGEALIPAPASYDKEYYEQAEKLMDGARDTVASHPNTNIVLKQGQPAFDLLDYAGEQSCDLIVMGSRGLGGIREFVLGSVSHNVVQHSKVPVLVIK